MRSTCIVVACFVVVLLLLPSAVAQITTGTVTGRVTDSTGGVVPGATVVLVNEAQGTRTGRVQTNAMGDYVIPNVVPATYTVEISFPSFKTSQRRGIEVSGGDRIGVPPIALELGETVETVTVESTAPIIQTQSGERSFVATREQIEALPINRANFTSLVAFTPGVQAGGASAGGTRLGGANQNNIMMDGISAMDTGNNGQMLSMNIESIGEVKVLTQGYQAEYGRSSGLQITAVTKNGTNEFHGSGYMILTDSDWDKDTWVRVQNNQATSKTDQQKYGYTVGGPILRNKLFFFYAHEFVPSQSGGATATYRFPTALERAGDFSESLDQNGNPIPALMDYTTGAAFPNQTIPSNRLYAPGVAAMNRYPQPNHTQVKGENYNWEITRPTYSQLTQQPAVRIDYQVTNAWRLTGKYSGQRRRRVVVPGSIPGFNDVYQPKPYITNYAFTANWMINPTTFLEATYGQIQNDLAGGGSGGILT
ncbi:MAG: TonB-dependent receptor, partial [Sedimentisphaerales bacterium]|nr:TonB-dependent receptor [Sedimentisphaerales bacterium]